MTGALEYDVAVVGGVWKEERPYDALHRYLEALYDRQGID